MNVNALRRAPYFVLLLCFLLQQSLTIHAQTTLYVRQNKCATCWTGDSIFNDLSPALKQAALLHAKGMAVTVWVAAGTYTPRADSTEAEATFTIPDGVRVYGGFEGNEKSFDPANDTRKLQHDQTILSGAVTGKRCSHVVTISDIYDTARLDGFTIKDGNTTGDGAGMLLKNNSGAVLVNRCTFTGNKAANGGAVCNTSDGHGSSNPMFSNCVFTSNKATGEGGAVYNNCQGNACNMVFVNCAFARNTAGFGGAIGNKVTGKGSANPLFSNCVLYKNGASQSGNAVMNMGGDGMADPSFVNCTFYDNAQNTEDADINNDKNGNPALTNCILAHALKGAIADFLITSTNTPIPVSHSIIYADPVYTNGTDNHNSDPQFADAAHPEGTDGIWLTPDDGLMVCGTSAAVGAGTAGGNAKDILGNAWSHSGHTDIGAYSAGFATPDVDKETPADIYGCAFHAIDISVEAAGAVRTYQWQISKDGKAYSSLFDNADYSGTGKGTLHITNILPNMDKYHYRCLITGMCTAPVTSKATTLHVSDITVIAEQPRGVNLCEGMGQAVFTCFISAAKPVLQWQVDRGNGVGYVNVPANDTFKVTGDSLVVALPRPYMNDYAFRCNVAGACGNATSMKAVLHVTPRMAIVGQPSFGNGPLCEGIPLSVSVKATGGKLKYQWQVALNDSADFDNIKDDSLYSGSNTEELDISAISVSMNGYSYRCVVSSGFCQDTISDEAKLQNIFLRPTVTQPKDVNMCEGTGAAVFVYDVIGTSPDFQWQVNKGDGKGFLNVVPGQVYHVQGDSLIIPEPKPYMNDYIFRCRATGVCVNVTSERVSLHVTGKMAMIKQPAIVDKPRCEGATVHIYTKVIGDGLKYKWQVNKGDSTGFTDVTNGDGYSGATTPDLDINDITAGMNGYMYRCVVGSGFCDGLITDTVQLTHIFPRPEVSTQPEDADATLCPGATARFAIAVTDSDVQYKWQVKKPGAHDYVSIDSETSGIYRGANTPLLVVGPTAEMDGYKYRCFVIGRCTQVASRSAMLHVMQPQPLSIASQPVVSMAVCAGSNATFIIAATGSELHYRWQVNTGNGTYADITGDSSNYSGVQSDHLEIGNVQPYMESYRYRCVVTGSCDSLISSAGGMHFAGLPGQPSFTGSNPVSVCAGANGVVYTVRADEASSFKWTYDGSGVTFDPSNPTGNTVALNIGDSATSGALHVTAYNACGLASDEITLPITVNPMPDMRSPDFEVINCGEDGNMCITIKAAPGTTALWCDGKSETPFDRHKSGEKSAEHCYYVQNDATKCVDTANYHQSTTGYSFTAPHAGDVPDATAAVTDSIYEGGREKFHAGISGQAYVYQWYKRRAKEDKWTPVGLNKPVYVDSTLATGDMIYCSVTDTRAGDNGNPKVLSTGVVAVYARILPPMSASIEYREPADDDNEGGQTKTVEKHIFLTPGEYELSAVLNTEFVDGREIIGYQWYKNSEPISNAIHKDCSINLRAGDTIKCKIIVHDANGKQARVLTPIITGGVHR